MKNKIKHLDCTLRDGGYYNNWFFNKELINEYLHSMRKLQIDYVEIGFRFTDKKKIKGPTAYTTENFLNSLKIPKDLKLGVMINAGDFLNKKQISTSLIDKFFTKKKNSKISLVRIACHHHEIPFIKPIVLNLKSKGYLVGINIMQISERTKKEIKNIINQINQMNIKILYFADSLGSLKPKDLKMIVSQIKKNWKGEIGIHTHDNMGKALDNTLEAIKLGVTWVDSTVTGMGRGPGNTKTEEAIIELNRLMKKKVDLLPTLNLIEKYFKKLKQKYGWGSNIYYYFAGIKGVHPSFVQQMIGDPTFPPDKILSNINYLSKLGGKNYTKELITQNDQIFNGNDVGEWMPSQYLQNKNILIIGPGQNLKKNISKVIKFIKVKKPIVLSLNFNNFLNEKYINFYVASNCLRLLVDLKFKKKLNRPIIVPYNKIKKLISQSVEKFEFLNFGLQVKNGIFEFLERNAVTPNSLVISYALAIATSGKSKKIYLAGLDGYSSDSPKKNTVNEVFSNFFLANRSIKIKSITPTLYKL